MSGADTRAQEIAGKLTKAQRDIVLGHLVEIPPDEADALETMGLKKAPYEVEEIVVRRVWPITPLGLAVRSILERQDHAE